MQTRTVRSVIYLAAGLGLIVSVFAAAEFFDATLRSICSINSFFSCALVDQSGRTSTLGVPDYAWGIGGFLAILVVAGIAEVRPSAPVWSYALLGLTSAGVVLSLYFLYVELAFIGALCVVCATAYGFGALAWIGSIELARRTRPEDHGDLSEEDAASTPATEQREPTRGP